jgi:hypothetical protein
VQVEDLARTVLRDPLRVTVGERNTAAAVVRQRLQFVGREEGKLMTLRQMMAGGLTPPVLVRGQRGTGLPRESRLGVVGGDGVRRRRLQRCSPCPCQ